MKRPEYSEFDDDVEWLFCSFMTVVADAIKNNVDLSLVARAANSVAAAAAKQNLETKIEQVRGGSGG